jgi:hypothetical protein
MYMYVSGMHTFCMNVCMCVCANVRGNVRVMRYVRTCAMSAWTACGNARLLRA